MKRFGKWFVQGLITVLPALVTVYVLFWLGSAAEDLLGGLLKRLLPEGWYIPGMGVFAGAAVIFGIGVLMNLLVFRKLFGLIDKLFDKIPLIKSLYYSLKDLVSFFDERKKKQFDKVVMVRLAPAEVEVMGLVTREDFGQLPEGIGGPDRVAVYLPMSYQMGGYMVMVPKEHIRTVDMNIEQAMQFVLTAGLSTTPAEK